MAAREKRKEAALRIANHGGVGDDPAVLVLGDDAVLAQALHAAIEELKNCVWLALWILE